jgi:hypothetical protein
MALFHIGIAARPARGVLAALEIQTDPAGTNPAPNTRGVAINQSIVGYVARHNRAGSHKRVPPYCGATDYGAVRPEGSALLYQSPPVLIPAHDVAARIHDVGEYHGRPAEYVVLQDAAGINGDIILDLDVVTDGYIWGDYDVLTDIAVVADPAILHDVREMPDLSPRAYDRGLVNK